jgi:large subunit ribosomal protein L35
VIARLTKSAKAIPTNGLSRQGNLVEDEIAAHPLGAGNDRRKKGRENSVPKIKTNRGAAKRFKRTGTGKIKAKRAFARHILTKKSANRKRVLRTPKFVEHGDGKGIKALLPYT